MFHKLEKNRKFKNNTSSFIYIIDETILLGLGKNNSKTWNSLQKKESYVLLVRWNFQFIFV